MRWKLSSSCIVHSSFINEVNCVSEVWSPRVQSNFGSLTIVSLPFSRSWIIQKAIKSVKRIKNRDVVVQVNTYTPSSSSGFGGDSWGSSNGKSSGGGRACHKCGQEGHISRECPTGGGSSGSRACYKCGQDGHMSRDCPSSGGPGKLQGKGCFKCGEEGHMSRECPNPGNGGWVIIIDTSSSPLFSIFNEEGSLLVYSVVWWEKCYSTQLSKMASGLQCWLVSTGANWLIDVHLLYLLVFVCCIDTFFVILFSLKTTVEDVLMTGNRMIDLQVEEVVGVLQMILLEVPLIGEVDRHPRKKNLILLQLLLQTLLPTMMDGVNQWYT